MQPEDSAALEEVRWSAFVQQLAEHLAAQWPAMPERLGERYPAFVEHALQQALRRGLTLAPAAARYVQLCFVWGPAFHDKPGFEWAQGLLAAPRANAAQQWALVHRLQARSLAELARLPETRIAPDTLAAADARLVAAFGALGCRGALGALDAQTEPVPLPRAACDIEALELRLADAVPTQVYRLEGEAWQRVDLPPPAPLRVDAARPLPRLVGLLSHRAGLGRQARLQARLRAHAQCERERHPALAFAGSHGLWRWAGHEAGAVSWPVPTLEQPLAPPGCAIAEESSPEIHRLTVEVCGLRDEGDPLGPLAAQVWAWPAEQWWLQIERSAAPEQLVQADREPARGATRCRVERDGEAQDAAALQQGFVQGLDAAVGQALQTLREDWSAVPGLTQPQLEGSLALLVGRAALTWGWHPGPQGLDGRALMRVAGRLALQAALADLRWEGEFALGASSSRLSLRCRGSAALALALAREAPEPPLLAAMLPARAAFRLPFEAELVPLGSAGGAVAGLAGPCRGALVGEAGLRPRTRGGSGFEWFAGLRVEALTLPLELVDPVLGCERRSFELLPARTLVDWSLG
ncbi:MAG: hypothetical protein U1F07_15455 [Rubrivivax sp.]